MMIKIWTFTFCSSTLPTIVIGTVVIRPLFDAEYVVQALHPNPNLISSFPHDTRLNDRTNPATGGVQSKSLGDLSVMDTVAVCGQLMMLHAIDNKITWDF
ncbi:hypothetical protein K449DRAFT_438386 [Hypoxylon sp. EC38]|nr:hypothetical protein K449DRAFT_438386 [Hypoxylon sp. EC38]